MTPIYDVLTAQLSLDNNEIKRNQMKLAMCVGTNRHYKINDIHVRHFIQTGVTAGLPKQLMHTAIEEIADNVKNATEKVESLLSPDFSTDLHDSVSKAMLVRLGGMKLVETN